MDWDKKFSSIVLETEANLDRVRKRLESAKSTASSPLGDLHYPVEELITKDENYTTRSRMKSRHKLFDDYKENTTPNSSGPPIWVTLLEEKFSAQQKIIEKLTDTVVSLQNEKENQKAVIRELQDSVDDLKNRMLEKGVDLDTETKLLKLKSETNSELAELKRQVKRQTHDRMLSDSNNYMRTIQDQMRETKSSCRDQCEWQQRDIEHIKTKIGRMENTVNILQDQYTGMERRQKDMKLNVSDFADNTRQNYSELATAINDRLKEATVAKQEMSSLRSELKGAIRTLSPQPYSQPQTTTLTFQSNKKGKEDGGKDWKELLSRSLSSISLESTESLTYEFEGERLNKHVPGGMTFDDSDLESGVTSPASLSINDL